MFDGYFMTAEEREELTSEIAGGTHTAYGTVVDLTAALYGE